MKKITAAVIVSLLVATGAWAQAQHGAPSTPGQGQASPAPKAGEHPMMGQGMMGSMSCPMMGGMMGDEMSGQGMMGGMMTSDPKAMARMLKLRGEMLKAMGEVMMKHGRALEQAK